jgi:peptidyl-prolyl cis-trans isomerase-like 4
MTLEILGDLPDSNLKPPENILFVCKLNPITQEKDL